MSRKSVSYAKVFNGGGCAPLVGEDAGDVGQGGMPRAEQARRGGNLSPEMKAAFPGADLSSSCAQSQNSFRHLLERRSLAEMTYFSKVG